MKPHNGQAQRIADYFAEFPNVDIPAPLLHQVGSGKSLGYCASLSRRISDLRATGMDIQKTKDEYKEGQRRTAYRYVKKENYDNPIPATA